MKFVVKVQKYFSGWNHEKQNSSLKQSQYGCIYCEFSIVKFLFLQIFTANYLFQNNIYESTFESRFKINLMFKNRVFKAIILG